MQGQTGNISLGRRKLTKAETEQFRQLILDKAEALFATQGYEVVSLRAIAGQVGCSPMTLYRYFDNKQDLFDTIRCLAFERFAAEQEAAAASASDPMEKIKALGIVYSKFADEHPNAFRLMFELQQSADPSPRLQEAGRQSFNAIRRATAEAIEAGVLAGDADSMAHLFWTSLHGVVTLDLAGKLIHGRNKKDLLETMFNQRPSP